MKCPQVAGFEVPGNSWKAQVASGAIKTVRRATKLDAENGVDSAVFFHGVEPFNALISTFEGPLKRLADK